MHPQSLDVKLPFSFVQALRDLPVWVLSALLSLL